MRSRCFAPLEVALFFAVPLIVPASGGEPNGGDAQAPILPMPNEFTIHVEVERPVNPLMPGQGRASRVMRVTANEEVTAMVWSTTRFPDPVYFPPETSGYQSADYDDAGRLLVNMDSDGATLRDASTHVEIAGSVGVRVTPNGEVSRNDAGSFLKRLAPSNANTESLFLLRRILWSLGLPPADDLEEAVTRGPGQIESRVKGRFGRSHSGAWHITFDAVDPLIRRGVYVFEGHPSDVEFENQGTRRIGPWTMAEQGEFKLTPETISVRLISFRPEFDGEIVARAREVIAAGATGAGLEFDYRNDPDRPIVRIRLQATEPDK